MSSAARLAIPTFDSVLAVATAPAAEKPAPGANSAGQAGGFLSLMQELAAPTDSDLPAGPLADGSAGADAKLASMAPAGPHGKVAGPQGKKGGRGVALLAQMRSAAPKTAPDGANAVTAAPLPEAGEPARLGAFGIGRNTAQGGAGERAQIQGPADVAQGESLPTRDRRLAGGNACPTSVNRTSGGAAITNAVAATDRAVRTDPTADTDFAVEADGVDSERPQPAPARALPHEGPEAISAGLPEFLPGTPASGSGRSQTNTVETMVRGGTVRMSAAKPETGGRVLAASEQPINSDGVDTRAPEDVLRSNAPADRFSRVDLAAPAQVEDSGPAAEPQHRAAVVTGVKDTSPLSAGKGGGAVPSAGQTSTVQPEEEAGAAQPSQLAFAAKLSPAPADRVRRTIGAESGSLDARGGQSQDGTPAATGLVSEAVSQRVAGRGPDTAATTGPAAPAALATLKNAGETGQSSGTVAHDIKLELAGAGPRVEVRVLERAGDVHVAVRTPDGRLADAMRDDLPGLAARLEQSGFHGTEWRVGAAGGGQRAIEILPSGRNAADTGGDPGGRGHEQPGQGQGQERQRPQAHPGGSRTREFASLISGLRGTGEES